MVLNMPQDVENLACFVFILYRPRTHMTPVLIGKGLALGVYLQK